MASVRIKRLLPIAALITVMGCAIGLQRTAEGFAFPRIDGWKKAGNIEHFEPANLFNHINGAAEFYLSFNFQQLWVAEYTGQGDASLVVEIYRFSEPVQAFGLYTQERSSFADIVDVGIQGYSEPPILNFLKGSYYVKLNGYGDQAMEAANLVASAQTIAAQLEGSETWPASLNMFPAEDQVTSSATYISGNYLGYDFFPAAYQCNYESDAGEYRVFIIEGEEPSDMQLLLEQYEPLTQSTGHVTEGTYMVADPYHGLVAIRWQARLVWGVLDLSSEETAAQVLEQTAASIKAYIDP